MSIGFRLELVNKKHFLPDKELLMLSDKGTGGFMEHTDDRGYTYFQFHKEFNIPIVIKVNLEQFSSDLGHFLNENGFLQLPIEENKKIQEILQNETNAKILKISEATPAVANAINAVREGDAYGLESVIPKEGYKVYRYKGVGLLIYSLSSKEWELGCLGDFGEGTDKLSYATILNRFLSWALAPMGVVGFWGVPVDEGVVVMKQCNSKGEVIFFDVFKDRVFTIDGVKNIKSSFRIMRLDRTLKGRNIRMNNAELLGFLSVHCSYFDYSGLSIPVRQMIQCISTKVFGWIHPMENFKPRTDLSL